MYMLKGFPTLNSVRRCLASTQLSPATKLAVNLMVYVKI